MSQVVHRIRYARSESSLLGDRGVGPVETTLSEGSLRTWDGFLRDHVPAAGPQPGFTFVTHGGVGVLIRKAGFAAQALLSRGLTARAALALTLWTGWDRTDLEVSQWSDFDAVIQFDDLRARARKLPLTDLFAKVLAAAGRPYTVIGEDDPVAALMAIGDLLGTPPTFATDEADDTAAHLPTAVFLREPPFSSSSAPRARFTLDGPAPARELRDFAGLAADAYATHGPEALSRLVPVRPPAGPDETRAWIASAQFAPGILADLTRLPHLDPLLAGRLDAAAVRRVEDVATAAPDDDLVIALDRSLPPAVAATIFRVALRRALPVSSSSAVVLDRLASLGPLAPDMMAEHLPLEIDRLAEVTTRLLTPSARDELLTQAFATLPAPDVMDWIDVRAADDPAAAYAGFAVLCRRGPLFGDEDLEALARHRGLARAVRQFTGKPAEAAGLLTDLLTALPPGTLGIQMTGRLAAGGDPALIHALDAVVTEPAVREALHRQIRVAWYRSHQLSEPVSSAVRPTDPSPWWQRFTTYLK